MAYTIPPAHMIISEKKQNHRFAVHIRLLPSAQLHQSPFRKMA